MVFSTERIIYLLRSYTDRTATDAERRELTEWLALHEDDGSFESHVQQLLQAYPAEKKIEAVDWEKIYSAIIAGRDKATNVRSTHRVHFLKTSWFRYAAAIVLLLGLGSYLWLFTSRNEIATTNDNKPLQTDILPGANRAILTLADGSTIVLDNATNGSLAQQGNTKVIKLDNGQLAYNVGNTLSKEILYNTISTPRGGQYQIILPDGSKVWLNAASSIKFPAAFIGAERNVELNGEAYMEIAKNTKQPFIANANGTEIKVLGTSFNINAYPDEGSVKTTLVEGSVRVSLTGASYSTLLKPHEQALVSDKGEFSINKNANVSEALAWKNGLFNFNKLSLQEIMRQLSRWYDVDVVYEGNIQPKKFGGEIQRDLKLSEVLEVLKDAGVRFRIDNKKLIVQP